MKFFYLKVCKKQALPYWLTALTCFMLITSQTAAQTIIDRSNVKRQSSPAPDATSLFVDITGSVSCQTLNASPDANLAHITTNKELRLNYTPPTSSNTFTFTNSANPSRTLIGQQDDPFNSITTQRVGNALNFSTTIPMSAVIVSAANNTNRVYLYPPGSTSDSGLQNPGNSTISSVGFCFYSAAEIEIVKQVQIFGGTASTDSFPFTATNLGPPSFSLVDNDVVGPDRYSSVPLYGFAKNGVDVVITESLVNNWTLSDISCVDTDYEPGQPQFANVVDFANRTVRIRLEEGETVTCTFTNTSLIPTAAQVEVSGRVTRSDGNGIGGAVLSLFNANTLETRTIITNPFGYYRITGVESGNFYILNVRHKSYTFPNPQRSFSIDDAMTDVNFIASP